MVFPARYWRSVVTFPITAGTFFLPTLFDIQTKNVRTIDIRHFEKAEKYGIVVLRPQELLHQLQTRL